MVQCAKKVLAHTVKKVAPKEDVLMSFLIGGASTAFDSPGWGCRGTD